MQQDKTHQNYRGEHKLPFLVRKEMTMRKPYIFEKKKIAEAQCEDRRDTLRTERSEDEKTEDKEKAE